MPDMFKPRQEPIQKVLIRIDGEEFSCNAQLSRLYTNDDLPEIPYLATSTWTVAHWSPMIIHGGSDRIRLELRLFRRIQEYIESQTSRSRYSYRSFSVTVHVIDGEGLLVEKWDMVNCYAMIDDGYLKIKPERVILRSV